MTILEPTMTLGEAAFAGLLIVFTGIGFVLWVTFGVRWGDRVNDDEPITWGAIQEAERREKRIEAERRYAVTVEPPRLPPSPLPDHESTRPYR